MCSQTKDRGLYVAVINNYIYICIYIYVVQEASRFFWVASKSHQWWLQPIKIPTCYPVPVLQVEETHFKWPFPRQPMNAKNSEDPDTMSPKRSRRAKNLTTRSTACRSRGVAF